MKAPAPVEERRRGHGGVSMLLYGLPGAGKTRLIGSGPKTLILRPPTDHTDSIVLPADVDEIEVDDWAGMLEVFQAAQQGGFDKYEWFWLDSVTLMQEFGLDDVFQAAIDRQPARAQYGPDKGEYGINMSRLGKFVRDTVGLAKAGHFNFGMTAHVMELHDPVADEELWAPQVQGKNMSHKFAGYMNIVAYLQKDDKGKRLLLTDAEGFVGKDQFDCFPALKSGRHGLVNPTMKDVDAAIKKARGNKPARKRAARSTTTTRKRAPRKRTTKSKED